MHDALIEGIVVADDDLMERYLADETIAVEELEHALAKGIADATVFPVLCGSATKLIGVDRLARFIAEDGPAPDVADGLPRGVRVQDRRRPLRRARQPVPGPAGHRRRRRDARRTTAPSPTSGSTSSCRCGARSRSRSKTVGGGDLAAVAKLSDTTTGDVLGTRGAAIDVERLERPEPVLPVAIRAKSEGDEDKLANALHRLQDEDPAVRIERNPETHQTLLWGMGETHLGIALERLQRKFGVAVETDDVKVAYRETITSTAEAEGRYKKQTGGHGQFGVAFLRVEPQERSTGFEFKDAVVGGAIPRQFIPAVEKGIAETMQSGGVFGYPVVDVAVDLLRRQVPLRRLVGDELQDGRLHRLQGGDGEGHPDPARTDQRARRHRARRLPGRHHGRPELEARPDPGIEQHRQRRSRRSSRSSRRPRSCATRSTCAPSPAGGAGS